MSVQLKPFMTPQEYLAYEREAATKSEYYAGELYALAGASTRHVRIMVNCVASLFVQLKGRSCDVFASDLRVKVSATGLYTYPDVVVVCGAPRFDDDQEDTLLNPTVIIEVLSKTTEAYGRGEKFAQYRTLESLSDYLLVAQDIARIEHFTRQADGAWLFAERSGLDATVVIPSIQCQLRLADVYDKIETISPTSASHLRVIKETAAKGMG